ncbi:putative ATP-dependent RNA helicase DBP6 [Lachancea thermotolerans CBS 6340]|uniref:ATP-dependent RNA helicase n=1 Tax=Lachancea thermotolerans (strain ATCC 56472 / CBS 6340 / NRRL Y-8284) TaxID=559295 RepID=C5DC17_LACTC|nr:KLTH0A07084p [Lachancea thermotolerans CBS 6340]CAR21324.1 KLTH0A07084p [Lachancea thermotolerans CBS 6340]
MFAARFDPTAVQSVAVDQEEKVRASKPVVPQKRRAESEEDSEEDEDEEKDEVDENENVRENHIPEENPSDEEDHKSDVEMDLATNDEVTSSKYSGVYSRFQKTLQIQDKLAPYDLVNTEDENDNSDTEQHELVPIPQPEIVRNTHLTTEVVNLKGKSAAWLHTARVQYDSSMVKPFSAYKDILNDKLISNVTSKFSENAFPVQTVILDTVVPKMNFAQSVNKKSFPRRVGDILVNASTGSGKTLAYSIPVVQCLSKRTVNRLRCLIVVPTKILIHQVFETLVKLSQGTSLITGISKLENSLREEHRKFQAQEPDILVITPGRLVDHLQLNTFSLKNLKFLILDEADRLLNQSFQNWCSVIMERLKTDKEEMHPVSVIKMVFSATLTTNTEKLHGLQLNRPSLFMMDSVKLYHLPKQLQEFNIKIPTAKSFAKPLFALQLIAALSPTDPRILVFVRSNEASIRLATLLEILVNNKVLPIEFRTQIASINSNNTKGLNSKLIKQFASSSPEKVTKILVATDLMSRGIDINNVSHVINYDLPISSQQYVHRCGRTARAQASGEAFNLLVGKGEQTFWSDNIDSDLSRDLDGCRPKPYEEEQALENILEITKDAEENYKDSLEQLKNNVTSK